jgi:hypothetical protein
MFAATRNEVAHLWEEIVCVGDRVVNATGQFHYTQAVLESLVGCSWIYEACQCKLMDMSEALEWPAINDLGFARIHLDERMDGVAYFVVRDSSARPRH